MIREITGEKLLLLDGVKFFSIYYNSVTDFGKVVWPCPKVFWLSEDNSAGHSVRKKKKR